MSDANKGIDLLFPVTHLKKNLFAVLTALYSLNKKTCAQRFWGNV